MPLATGRRMGIVMGLPLLAAACATGVGSNGSRPGAAPKAAEPAAREPAALPPLTPREAELVPELEKHVRELAGDIGERHLGRAWNLASATDALALSLEGMGYSVNRLGYSVGEDVVQNLEVELHGRERGEEVVVVGAHFDTHPGAPGADDNASGVAGVLCLAKAFQRRQPDRTLRFVLFANEEQPHFGTPAMGSLVYAKAAAERGDKLVAMLNLESIGYYDDEPGSQRYPKELEGRFPETGDFLAIVANPESSRLLEQVEKVMRQHANLPIVAAALPPDVPGVGDSDHWAFWSLGFPAIMLTDTAPYRNPHYHRPSDLPATLDFERMARIVRALEATLAVLVGADAGGPAALVPAGSGERLSGYAP